MNQESIQNLSQLPNSPPLFQLSLIHILREVTISIVDHGCGVAEKDKPYIFDRFYCADKSRSDKTHFGLGLSIALELSKMLEGTVGFTDTTGGGATFYITLPITKIL